MVLIAVVVAWGAERLAVLLIKRFLTDGAEPSRGDFVGRTGRVTAASGGRSARPGRLLRHRRGPPGRYDDLPAGTVAALYDVDPDGDFLRISAATSCPALHARQRSHCR